MGRPTREEYERARETNQALRASILHDNDELTKCIDKMCCLRMRIIENQHIITQNNIEIIDKYEFSN